MINRVIYTGAFRFPDKDAASQRVLGIGKSLRRIGFEVIFCGWEKEGRREDLTADGRYVYQGFDYFSQSELDLKPANVFLRVFNFLLRGRKTIRWLKGYLREHAIDYIIAYNANVFFLLALYVFCKRRKIELIGDCTEWYEANHLPGGKWGLANMDNNIRLKWMYPLIKHNIVISSFLKEFLARKGCNTIVVPPLVDLKEEKWAVASEKSLQLKDTIALIYAGEAGKKDLMRPIIEAIEEVNKDQPVFWLHILGITEEELVQQFRLEHLPRFVTCVGRVNMAEVPMMYSKCHFSILIRENKRYANAGFPTKFVESLSCHVPVIANNTSDLSDYLVNGMNGFLLNSNKQEELINVLKQISNLSPQEYDAMREGAFNSSRVSFQVGNYDHIIGEFLNNLR